MKRWLRLILAALTPLCISAVCLSTNRGLSAPPSIEKNIAETAAPGYKTWWDVHPAPVQSLRGGFDGPPRPRQPGIVFVNVGKRVIQRELSFLRPIVRLHQRGSVLFLSDGSFKAIRPDYPWGLELVESETGDEAETVRLETTARNDNPNYDEEGGESRVWHFPMLPPCALVVPTAQPRDHLPTEDPAPVRIQVSMSWEGRVAVFEETVAGRHEGPIGS
ncbi:hypothetical protein T484DRAFT_3055851 [Baffinella frigidus]|nr:hypothetical protein T484DRAFT_3055851 [Cryptophyta sp. CCMP2293]